MTKDWDAVHDRIRDLSVNQKKCLQDVKAIMESTYSFRASTRAYRMKLKEWGYMRHKPRNHYPVSPKSGEPDVSSEGTNPDDSQTPIISRTSALSVDINSTLSMLSAVLVEDIEKLENLLVTDAGSVNCPLGLSLDEQAEFLNRRTPPTNCVILQHPMQTVLDVASAMPSSSIVQLLLNNGATGSTHHLGSDLALHNAIKNGRTSNVKLLLRSHSSMNGAPGCPWRPLRQAAFWNHPDIVRFLLQEGAEVNQPTEALPSKSTLQIVLDRRVLEYENLAIRGSTEDILIMLLQAGAAIVADATHDIDRKHPFETFLEPWQNDPLWYQHISLTAQECFIQFIMRGANIQTQFSPFPCTSSSGHTLAHQIIWHAPPQIARHLVDTIDPSLGRNGEHFLHELVGSCVDSKRHPADTLRDMEVLIKNGASLDIEDREGLTPLTACLQRCPAVDISERVMMLLNRGADPNLCDRQGADPMNLAIRLFNGSLQLKLVEALITNHRTGPSSNSYLWKIGYWSISDSPTFAEVTSMYGAWGLH